MQKLVDRYRALSPFTKGLIHLAIGVVLFSGIRDVLATPGGLDGAGCHHPKGGAYHCHMGKKVQGEATRAQCSDMKNDGWCTKFQRKKRVDGH